MKKLTSFSFSHYMSGVAALVGCLLMLAASVASAEDKENHGQFTASDYKFAKAAAEGGSFEVALGRIAAQKATLPDVRKFGEKMVEDHSKAGEKLQGIATSLGATLPMQPTAKQQKHIDKMNALKGLDFDKEYVEMMAEDHKEDLKEFQKAAKNSDNAALKAFATETSTVVEHHLNLVKTLKDQVKTEKKRSTE